MLDQQNLWDKVSWIADDPSSEAADLRDQLAAYDSGWSSDDGLFLFENVYRRLPPTGQELLERAAENAISDPGERPLAVQIVQSGVRNLQRETGRYATAQDKEFAALVGLDVDDHYWDGTDWQPAVQNGYRWDEQQRDWVAESAVAAPDTHPDAVALASLADDWNRYAAWWRRYDDERGAYVYARSNKVADNWVSDQEMIEQDAAGPRQPESVAASPIHQDAVELANEPGWERYSGWWRHYDNERQAYLFAESNLVADTWVTDTEMARLAEAALRPAPKETVEGSELTQDAVPYTVADFDQDFPEFARMAAAYEAAGLGGVDPEGLTETQQIRFVAQLLDAAEEEVEAALFPPSQEDLLTDEVLEQLRAIEGIETIPRFELLAMIDSALAQ